MPIGKFSNTGANKAATAASPARGGGKRRSRYAGIEASAPRDPMPTAGDYRFRVTECVEGHNPGTGTDSFKVKLEVVESDGSDANSEGENVLALFLVSGKGGQAGLSRVKSFVMAAAGYDDEEAFNEFDPEGEFIDSCTGAQNEFSDMGGVAGRLVDCRVTRGNATPTGDYYREYSWAPVGDDEQTS